ncbi:MAG TPA: outer membrane beta-barrel protein [Gemmatimonadales bacterium]|nr:outer membrane beta-barrel protein [Gemmatimonadales bacterium]
MRAAGRLALLLALAPAPLSAQAWYTIGGGAGGNRVSCADCEKIERFWGGSGYLRAGGTVGRNVSVGGEFAFWQASIDGSDAYLRAIEGVVLWHPKPPGGFFGQAGLGLGRIRNVYTIDGETVRASETGLSVMVGVGYDLRVGKRVFLTPSVMSIAVPTATIDTPAGPLDNVVSTLFFAGLGVTIR